MCGCGVCKDTWVLVTSRSFSEYEAFFALEPDDLNGRILDCCAGASGFAAEATARGIQVTAADPAYRSTIETLGPEAMASNQQGSAILDQHDDRFTWSWYGTPERRNAMRRAALAAFLDDIRAAPDRYVAAALPDLPFPDRAFNLALCSHLLFTWADIFDERWHLAALTELLRVASEVRVFPLVLQGTGEPVPFLPALVEQIGADGYRVEIETVPYEFQIGANKMLRLRQPAS